MSEALTNTHLDWARNFTGVDLIPGGDAAATADPGFANPPGDATNAAVPAADPAIGTNAAGAGSAAGATTNGGVPSTAKDGATNAGAPGGGAPATKAPNKAPAQPAATPADADAARIKTLADRIPIRVDVFLNTWLIAVTQAIDEVPPPQVDDPSAKGNFYRALGGNMVWAATSLFPEWQPIVIAMSFMGAAIGTGVGADPAAQQPPSPTKDLHDRVDKARDALSSSCRGQAAKIAADIIKSGAQGVDAEDQALWNRIFDKIAFNSVQALKAKSVAMVTSAVKQYTDQWNAWVAQTNKDADGRTAKILTQTAGGRMPAGFAETIRAGQLKQVRQENPFNPTLKL